MSGRGGALREYSLRLTAAWDPLLGYYIVIVEGVALLAAGPCRRRKGADKKTSKMLSWARETFFTVKQDMSALFDSVHPIIRHRTPVSKK
jgi:hypothetical protein